MDITEAHAARFGITSGVRVDWLGRWVLGLFEGRIGHADIARSPARRGEVAAGWAFHFLVGGGGVALLYPAALALAGPAAAGHPLLGGVLASTLSHLPCGLGVGVVLAAGARV
jgi:hypothetical protein